MVPCLGKYSSISSPTFAEYISNCRRSLPRRFFMYKKNRRGSAGCHRRTKKIPPPAKADSQYDTKLSSSNSSLDSREHAQEVKAPSRLVLWLILALEGLVALGEFTHDVPLVRGLIPIFTLLAKRLLEYQPRRRKTKK